MLESYLVSVLNRYVGEYLEDLNTDQLSIGLLSGQVELENVPLKKTALSKFDIPIDIKSGVVGKLIVTIPITAIRSEPWIVNLNDVFILLEYSEKQYLGKEESEIEVKKKEELLKELEEIHKKILLRNTNLLCDGNDREHQSWTNSIISSIIRNIRLIVTNVHIRYEDNKTISQDEIFSFGLKIKNINFNTTDSQWKKCYINETSDIYLYKNIDIEGASIYWNTNERKLSDIKVLDDLKNIFLNNDFINDRYIIQPFELEIQITKNTSKLHLIDKKNPRAKLNIISKKLAFDITEFQLIQIRALANEFKRFNRFKKYRKWRPKEKITGNSILWWRFAIDIVINDIKRKNLRNTWEFALSNAKIINKYSYIYKKKLILYLKDEIEKQNKNEIFKTFDLLEEVVDSQGYDEEIIFMKQVDRDNQISHSVLQATRDCVCKKIITKLESYFNSRIYDIDKLSINTLYDVSKCNGFSDIPTNNKEFIQNESSSNLYKWFSNWFSTIGDDFDEPTEQTDNKSIGTDVDFPISISCILPTNSRKVEKKMEEDLHEVLNEMLDDSTTFVRDKILAVLNLNLENIIVRIIIKNYINNEYNCFSIDLSKVSTNIKLSIREHKATVLLNIGDFNVQYSKIIPIKKNQTTNHDFTNSINNIFNDVFINGSTQIIFTISQSKIDLEKYDSINDNHSTISMCYSRFSPKTTVFHKLNAQFAPLSIVFDESSVENFSTVIDLFNSSSNNSNFCTNQNEESIYNHNNHIYCYLKFQFISGILKTKRKYPFNQSVNTKESRIFTTISLESVNFGVSKTEEYLTKYKMGVKYLCIRNYCEEKFSKLLEIKNNKNQVFTRKRCNSLTEDVPSLFNSNKKTKSSIDVSDKHYTMIDIYNLYEKHKVGWNNNFIKSIENDFEVSDDNNFIVSVVHVEKSHQQFFSRYKENEYNFEVQISHLNIDINQHILTLIQYIIELIPEDLKKHDFNFENDWELQELMLQGLRELDPTFNINKNQMNSKKCSNNEKFNNTKKIFSLSSNVVLNMNVQEIKISMNLPKKELCLGVINFNGVKIVVNFDRKNDKIPIEICLTIERFKIDNSIPVYNNLYQQLLSIQKKNSSYNNESSIEIKILTYRNYDFDLERPYDIKINIRIDESFKLTYLHLHEFFCLTINFWINYYTELIYKLSKGGSIGTDDNKHREFITRTLVEININCPVFIVLPLNQFSNKCIIMKMSKVEASNNFVFSSQLNYMNDYGINININQDNYDCLFDSMNIFIYDLEIFEGERILKNSENFLNYGNFLDGFNDIIFSSNFKSILSKKYSTKIIFGRNLSSFINHNAPNMVIAFLFENIDINLTTNFYKLIMGFLKYNVGDYTQFDINFNSSDDEISCPLNFCEEYLKQHINISFRMQFTNANIILLTPSKLYNYWDNFGTIFCENAILGFDSYMECQYEINFIAYCVQLIDTKFDSTKKDLYEKIFSKVLLQKNNYNNSEKQISGEMHIFFKNDDIPVVTFTLQKTQLLIIPDWFIELKEFFFLESDFDLTLKDNFCDNPKVKDYLKNKVDNFNNYKNYTNNMHEVKQSIAMRIQLTDCDVVFIENLFDPRSLAIKCFVTTTLQLNDKTGYLSVDFIVQKMEVSWCILAEEKDTNCVISTPFNIEIKLDVISDDLSSNTLISSLPNSYNSPQHMTKYYITTKIDNCSFRLSYKDILVILNVIKGYKKLLDTSFSQIHWVQVIKDELTSFNTIKIKKINCLLTDFSLWILKDFNEPILPIMKLSSSKWNFIFMEKILSSKGVLSIEYFNQKLLGWEPFLEPVEILHFNLDYHEEKSIYSEFKVSPKSNMDINITTHLIQQFKTISSEFLQIKKNFDSNFRNFCEKGRNNNITSIIKNKLGCNIYFTSEIDKLFQKDGRYQQNVKWSIVEAEKEIEFCHLIDRSHLYSLDYNDCSRLVLSIDGYEKLQPINIDTIQIYSINAKKHKNFFEDKELKFVKLLISISIDSNGRKIIDVRTAYSLTNFLNIPVILKINNSINGSEDWIDVKISPNEIYYIPLKYVYSRIYCYPMFSGKNLFPLTKSEYLEIILNEEYYEHEIIPTSFSKFIQNNKKFYAMLSKLVDDKISNTIIPGFNVLIYPPLFIRNQLPTDIYLEINGENVFCQAGNMISIANINIDKNVLLKIMTDRLTSLEFLEISKSYILKLQNRYSKPIPIIMIDKEKRKINIYFDISLTINGSIIIVFWVTYWIVNKSGIPLIIKKKESFDDVAGQLLEHEQGNDKIPLILSFNNNDEIKKCNLRIGKSFLPDKNYIPQYSSYFKLIPGEQSLVLYMKHQNKPKLIYNIGIEVRQGTGRYKNTQVVIFSPRYLLINQCSFKIYLSHIDDINFEKYSILDSNSNLIWNESFEDNKMICIKRYDVKYWSQPFRIDQVGSYFITMRDNDKTPNFVRAEIILSNARFCITFSNTEFYPPPIQIINESSIPILYQQFSNNLIPNYLTSICKPYKKIDYAWDFLYGQKLLSLQASTTSSHYYDPTKSTNGPSLYYENYSYIFLESSLSGLIKSSNTYNSFVDGFVLTVVDSNYVKLMAIDKNVTNLKQLWNFTSEGVIENVGLNNFKPNSSNNFVLDLHNTQKELFLVVSLRDKTRNTTQMWKFNNEGNFSCGLLNGYLIKSVQNYLKISFIKNINNIDCYTFKKVYQKEGTGILNVQCNHVGPTFIVRVSFPQSNQLNKSSTLSNNDNKIEINIIISNGIGFSLINATHQELFYGRLKGVYLNMVENNNSYMCTFNVHCIQIDNQLNEAHNYNFFFCECCKENERLTNLNKNLSQDGEIMLYLTSSAMKIELNYTLNENYHSFEYFKILFSNISINLDEQLLWKFIEFIQESGTAESVQQINLLQPPNINFDNVNNISMKRCYFGNFILNIGDISLSIITIPTNIMEKKMQTIKQNFNIRLMSFENASIKLPPFIQAHTFETITFFIECLKKFYINELYRQTFNIIVSLDAFGNPLGLATDIKDSFQTLIFEGNVSGFVSGFSYGVVNSFSKVMLSMSTGVGTLITDKEYELKRRKAIKLNQNLNEKNPLIHLYSGFKGLGTGVISGTTAILENTIKETRNNGLIIGLVKGVSTGVVDTVTKPVQGVFDFIGGTATAMKEVVGSSYIKKQYIPRERLRLTRVCNNLYGLLQPYKIEYALGQQLILTKFNNISSKSVLLEIEVYDKQKIDNEYLQLCALICSDKTYFIQKNNGNFTKIIHILDFKNFPSKFLLIPKKIEKLGENIKYAIIFPSKYDSKINKTDVIQIMVYCFEKAQILCDKLNRAKELYDHTSKNI